MKLTTEQIEFLEGNFYKRWTLTSDGLVDIGGNVDLDDTNLTEIPVKFGFVSGYFSCSNKTLTTLKNFPVELGGVLYIDNNLLMDIYKNLKEDFLYWENLDWEEVLNEYPFLINFAKKYLDVDSLEYYLCYFPLTKIYYKD